MLKIVKKMLQMVLLLSVVGSLTESTTNETTSSSSPTPLPITTAHNEKVHESAEKAKGDNKVYPLSLSDVNYGGYFLLPVSFTFTLVNGLLLGLIYKNWKQISDSFYYNATLLCVLLTSSDLALSLLVGLPIGIRLTFEVQLREDRYLRYYTEVIGFLLFEYLYILRVIIVAVISVERCYHILLPFKYMMTATKQKIKIACGIIVLLPFLRIVPVICALFSYTEAKVHCIYYNDAEGSDYYAPLTCILDLPNEKLPGFALADIVIMAVLIGISWFAILVSNVLIVLMVFDKAFAGIFSTQQKIEMNKKLMKISIVVLLISTSFALTNFPFAYAWVTQTMSPKKHYKRHYYLILVAFLSLLFHPWFYCLRMKNIKDLVTGFKKRVTSFKSTTSFRSSATGSVLFSFTNTRASAALIFNRANSRV